MLQKNSFFSYKNDWKWKISWAMLSKWYLIKEYFFHFSLKNAFQLWGMGWLGGFSRGPIPLPFRLTLLPSVLRKGNESGRIAEVKTFLNLEQTSNKKIIWSWFVIGCLVTTVVIGFGGAEHNTSNRKSHKLVSLCESTLTGCWGVKSVDTEMLLIFSRESFFQSANNRFWLLIWNYGQHWKFLPSTDSVDSVARVQGGRCDENANMRGGKKAKKGGGGLRMRKPCLKWGK